MGKKTVFLDRDGVINRCAPPHQYIRTWSAFVFLPGVVDALRLLNENGYQTFIVSNQRGIARGIMSLAELQSLHKRMSGWLSGAGAHIDGIYICPHEEGTCTCRKPEIGLFLMAEREHGVDKARSWLVGDSKTDIDAGRKYGVKTILLGENCYGQDYSCVDLLRAAKYIVRAKK